LAVAELGYENDWVWGGVVGVGGGVGGSEHAGAGGGCAEPFLRVGCRFLGLFEGGLEVGDGCKGAGGGEVGGLDLEGPEVED
jgi:hypothetical protein